MIKYANKHNLEGSSPTVTDIRFTNEEDVTCKLFVQEFDNREFDQSGVSHGPLNRSLEEMSDVLFDDTKLKVDFIKPGFGALIP